ncbi:MAG TPA: MFS transporter [Micromonosporaceae bacterium]|nr:MFS transporter [Micromonosporaceae bacterium]
MPDQAADGSEHAGVLQTFRELPRAARFALGGAFVNQLGAFVQLFLVLYLTHRGFSGEQAGLALGAYAIGAIAGTVFGGSVSDRLGPRRTIVLSMVSTAVFTAVVTALNSFVAIAAVVALSGALTQAARPAVSALLFGAVPKARQTMVFAMYATAINAGAILGPLAATWLSTTSWNLMFWFDAATSLVYGVIIAVMVPKDHVATAEPAAAPAARQAGYRSLLRDHRYLAYLSLMLANGMVHIQYFVVVPLMLMAAGYHTWAYGVASAVAASIVVGGNMLVTTVTQKWPPWVAVITGWTLLVIGRSGYGLPGGYAVVIATTALAATGVVIGGASAFAYPAKVAPDGAVGRYIGSAHAAFQSGYMIGPALGVLLWHSLGRTFFAICLAFGLLMIIPGVWGMRPARPADPALATPGRQARGALRS